MSPLQLTRSGVSRRDVGAGLVAGVAALVANVLFHVYLVAQVVVSNPASVFADPDIVRSVFQWDSITVAALAVTPVVAVVAGTVVWRVVVPEAPMPRRGAVAGVVTAFLSLLGLALAFGGLAALSELPHGAPFVAVSAFLNITAIVFVFGSVLAGAVFAPVGAAVGYGYEWYLSRRRDASLGS